MGASILRRGGPPCQPAHRPQSAPPVHRAHQHPLHCPHGCRRSTGSQPSASRRQAALHLRAAVLSVPSSGPANDVSRVRNGGVALARCAMGGGGARIDASVRPPCASGSCCATHIVCFPLGVGQHAVARTPVLLASAARGRSRACQRICIFVRRYTREPRVSERFGRPSPRRARGCTAGRPPT